MAQIVPEIANASSRNQLHVGCRTQISNNPSEQDNSVATSKHKRNLQSSQIRYNSLATLGHKLAVNLIPLQPVKYLRTGESPTLTKSRISKALKAKLRNTLQLSDRKKSEPGGQDKATKELGQSIEAKRNSNNAKRNLTKAFSTDELGIFSLIKSQSNLKSLVQQQLEKIPELKSQFKPLRQNAVLLNLQELPSSKKTYQSKFSKTINLKLQKQPYESAFQSAASKKQLTALIGPSFQQ